VRTLGSVLVGLMLLTAVGAPALAPHRIDTAFPGLLNAPPTVPRLRDESGRWRAPFIYPWALVSQLEQRYTEDRTRTVPLTWFVDGQLVQSADEASAPLLVLGTDSFGRDVFARLAYGAQVSLGLAMAAGLGAMLLGGLIGAIAGYAGGATDDVLMRASDFVLVLPSIYVALALRSALPLVLAAPVVFFLLAAIFTVLGAPLFARGVRAIVRAERQRDYVVAAASLGAGPMRLITRHLLPAAGGFMLTELTLLVPAFVIAEATLSYVGFGFPDTVATWGTMLHDASNVRTFADFPWLLSPAAAMFLVVLGLNLLLQRSGVVPVTVAYNSDR
jgi:peptide/nickel transport system permease protein